MHPVLKLVVQRIALGLLLLLAVSAVIFLGVEALPGELARLGVSARLVTVGCVGMCFAEPLLEIAAPGLPRVAYQRDSVELFLRQGSGLGVLRALQTAKRPIERVVLTNFATDEIRHQCLALGAARVFDKSSEIDDLVAHCLALRPAAA